MKPRAAIRSRDAARRLFLLLILLGLAVGGGAMLAGAQADPAAPNAPADTTESVADTTSAANRVLAYYFHTTQRCATCRKIEAYTAEAITAGFPEELKSGRLVFRAVNIDEKDNAHFAKDYQLFTKSVILVDERSGKQAAWKNLPKIWELVGEKEEFVRYIQEQTRGYLSGKQS